MWYIYIHEHCCVSVCENVEAVCYLHQDGTYQKFVDTVSEIIKVISSLLFCIDFSLTMWWEININTMLFIGFNEFLIICIIHLYEEMQKWYKHCGTFSTWQVYNLEFSNYNWCKMLRKYRCWIIITHKEKGNDSINIPQTFSLITCISW